MNRYAFVIEYPQQTKMPVHYLIVTDGGHDQPLSWMTMRLVRQDGQIADPSKLTDDVVRLMFELEQTFGEPDKMLGFVEEHFGQQAKVDIV